jgi:hypothetical protein
MKPLEIFGIPMPWDAPSIVFNSLAEMIGIIVVGVILLIIGILFLTNRINIGSPLFKWPIGVAMLVVGGYLLLVVI